MFSIYGKDSCAACNEAKELLSGKDFEYKLLGKDYSVGDFYEIAPRSVRSFPMIAKDGVYFGGLAELKTYLKA